MNFLESIKKNKKLIWFLAKDDIKKKYAGSSLGVIWAFVQPCVTIIIYWFVFQVGLRAKTSAAYENVPYLVWLICGLIPWFYFQDCLNSITNVFVEYSYLVKKVVFDIQILPIIKLLSATFIHLFFIILLILIMSLFGLYPNVCFIQIFYYSFCISILGIAIGYFTSAVTVFFRDMPQVVQVILQAGMWITPILWTYDMVSGFWFAPIFKLNPMYYIVEGYRSALLGNVWFFQNIKLTIYFWVLIVLLILLGNRIFKKLKPHFADVL